MLGKLVPAQRLKQEVVVKGIGTLFKHSVVTCEHGFFF